MNMDMEGKLLGIQERRIRGLASEARWRTGRWTDRQGESRVMAGEVELAVRFLGSWRDAKVYDFVLLKGPQYTSG